ncbi:MAG: DUF4910 domain-containing protein [Lachnospiraceae bacterium]|nr:DUF4910 domain-containing protein [Lachnospiraceae bacterium]MBQ9607151.1 DUF4910 domain-containing protein [Lachnospiraceae bacterium]MBR1524933.1 DUF4910 domain-containing protein [Lachnospiraceae bacterium]
MTEGQKMYDICREIFPLNRSITGNAVRETFRILQSHIPDIKFEMQEVPSGTRVCDWTVPDEWNCDEAYLEGPDGEKIVDMKDSNLHVMGYSLPTDTTLPLEEMSGHIYYLEDQPKVFPYVTSYYSPRWGFSMTYEQYKSLKSGDYHAVIRSTLEPGSMTYGEILIPGETEDEIFFSSYTCHPSMANNECSGPSLIVALARYIKDMPKRRYSYRLILAPETIGAITYIDRNLPHMKKHVKAAFNLTCVGDDRTYSVIHSRYGDTYADRVLTNVLSQSGMKFEEYPYIKRGSDERQYQAPGVDIPMACFCRSKYHIYPEYHTSADNLDLISPEGLQGSYDVMVKCINLIEYNRKYRTTTLCEPQLGKRGLVPTMSSKETYQETLALKDLIAYADGRNDLIGISEIIEQPVDLLIPLVDRLLECGLFRVTEDE